MAHIVPESRVTEAQADQLKAAHPGVELHVLDGAPVTDNEIVVRPPTQGEWHIYKSHALDPEKRPGAARFLVTTCAVFPDKETLKSILDARPGLADSWSGEIQEIAGVLKGDHRRKL
jgi:hypothetical protein